MRSDRTSTLTSALTLTFVLLLALSPILSACGPRPAPTASATASPAGTPTGLPPTSVPPSATPPIKALPTDTPVPTPTRPPLPPVVLSITPDRGEEQVLAAPVTITFDQAMDPASTSSAFSIEPKVPGEVKVTGNQLIFSPTERLQRGAEYKVTLASAASSAAGLKLQAPVSFKFATAGFLQVTNTLPAANSKDVPVDSPITVAFNRPVVALMGVTDQARLPQPLIITPTVVGQGEWLNTSIYRFTPRAGLAASTLYTVTAPAGLTDTTGGILAEPYTLTFRTTDPTVLSWSHRPPAAWGPPPNLLRIPIEGPITATFSMPMDRASTEAAFSLVDTQKNAVPGIFSWNAEATTLGFKPTRLLGFRTNYTATVAASARPANGQGALRSASSHAFRTVALPGVLRTQPVNNARQVDTDDAVLIYFTGPINPDTLASSYTILPKPTRVYTYYNEYESIFSLNFEKLPATAYTITLAATIADRYGNLLGADHVLRFTTGDYDPLIQLTSAGRVGTYNAYTDTAAVVIYRNIPQVTLTLWQVTPDDFVPLAGRDYWIAWDKFRPAQDKAIAHWTVETDAPRNETGMLRAALAQPDGQPLAPGLYYLTVMGATAEGRAVRDSYRQLLARTTYNVTLKAGVSEALAWVTDLRSGQPVAGVAVRFTDGDDIDRQAVSDKDGIARVTLDSSGDAARQPWDTLLALASGPGSGFGVAASNWQDGISAWDFKLQGGAVAEPYIGYVYTDRPIYRPGQTVYWKALIRRDDDAAYTLPAPGQAVTVTINDDQGNRLHEERLTISALGAVDGVFVLGAEAGLGYYHISLQLADAPRIIGGRSREAQRFGVGFQVAEYRKPEYEISAQTHKPEYIQGEQIQVTVQADYFFGGPVKNARVSWVLLSNDYTFQSFAAPKDAGGRSRYYSFGDWDWYAGYRESFGKSLGQGEGVTDGQGRFTFTVPADVSTAGQSQRFIFDITILDANNQTVSTQANAIVHQGALYIGLSPRSYVSTVGKPSQVDLVTVDPQGQRLGRTEVTIIANEYKWYSVREQAADGRFYWTSKAEKTPVYTATVTTDAAGQAIFEWTPLHGGQHKIEATARDRAGHTIRSAAFVWVSDRAYVSWRAENNDRIELVADKKEYNVGDVAEILVASPYQGAVKALLTIERGRIISAQVIELKSNSEVIRIPIEPRFAPDVFVSLALIKGMDATSPTPSFKVGLAQLNVSVADKELKVVLTPRKTFEVFETSKVSQTTPLRVSPRDKVLWEVQTLDAAGKGVPAEVSLALVDKAILTLASDNAGKLMDRFYRQRPLGVTTAATLVMNMDRIVAQLTLGGKGGGGGGDMAGPSVRREFPDIAYWNAVVTTDASGKATVEVTLPDNLTTWTMDARAITADTLVGQTQADIIATKDLLVRPVLPRFFVEGDQAQIAAVIHNNTQVEVEVEVKLEATGLALALATAPARPGRSRGLAEAPSATQTRKVPAQDSVKLTWDVSVQPNVAQVKTTMSAIQNRQSKIENPLSDAVEITLPVHRYTTPEVTGTSGQVALLALVQSPGDEGRLELVRLPAGADPTRGELVVTVEPSLAAGMTGGLTYLAHYPYECIEQTMSRFLPNVVSYQALKSLGVKRPEMETILPQQVGVGLQRIYARQRTDGGWGWWASDDSSVAVSSYVLYGLAKARQAGFSVDPGVIDRAVRYLRRTLGSTAPAGKPPAEATPWQLNQQAFTLLALAEAGAAEPNRAGALYEKREALSLFAKAYLALALGLIADDASPNRIKALLADISGRAIVSATAAHWEEGWTDYWNMNTDTRTTAIVLAAIARLDPKNSLGPNAVRWLMSARKADYWATTQENAWAIMALTDWMAATGELAGDYTWRALLNNTLLGEGQVTPATVDKTTTLRAFVGAGPDARSGAPASGPPSPPLLADQTNGLVIQRSKTDGQTGKGQLYYTAHLKTYLPVEQLKPLSRGVIVSREYRLAECGLSGSRSQGAAARCPVVAQARVGDVLNVTVSIVVPHALHYLIVEDPLPAGVEAIDVSLRTTSVTAQGPDVERAEERKTEYWRYGWWSPTHVELRDEKAVMFATWLAPGAYEFNYQVRAALPGRFLTLPATAYEMYFPEVWGRGAGSLFTVTP